MNDIEMIIKKVNTEFPEYKINKILRLNNSYNITVRGLKDEIMKGVYLEYKNDVLTTKEVIMDDISLLNKYEIVYDAYPGEF